ncbi:predicted protein [Chaetomium globosum CBS 148.51]|uniref:Uncharacterized protein n=1 Tax=Chaetomium globosum (strain ATCC 6205 / CBS 148.51 / DSM 1962 / NBRC 6347 / NRRL 1970) TaxID=306901 RepID=Q2H9Q3_CHAGB|nr:uncharacterized protein CHGG_03051 [Chaetomium globosum CBS 148.51]EAQ91116.1 predicted protein [Chaetomium globosum CBS 148.51]
MSGRDSRSSSSVYSQDSDRERRRRQETRPRDYSSSGPIAAPGHASYINSVASAGGGGGGPSSGRPRQGQASSVARSRNTDSLVTFIDSRPQSSAPQGAPGSSARTSSATLPFILDTNSPGPAPVRPQSSSTRTSSATLPFVLDTGSTQPARSARPQGSGATSTRSSQQSVRSNRSEGFQNFLAGVPSTAGTQLKDSGRESQKNRRERRRD